MIPKTCCWIVLWPLLTYLTNKPLNDIIAVAYAPWLPPPLLINAAALKNDSITQLRRHTVSVSAVKAGDVAKVWSGPQSIDRCVCLLSLGSYPKSWHPATSSLHVQDLFISTRDDWPAYLIAPRYTDMYVIGHCHLILIAIRSQRARGNLKQCG